MARDSLHVIFCRVICHEILHVSRSFIVPHDDHVTITLPWRFCVKWDHESRRVARGQCHLKISTFIKLQQSLGIMSYYKLLEMFVAISNLYFSCISN